MPRPHLIPKKKRKKIEKKKENSILCGEFLPSKTPSTWPLQTELKCLKDISQPGSISKQLKLRVRTQESLLMTVDAKSVRVLGRRMSQFTALVPH